MNIYLYVLDTLADWEIGYLTAELNSKRYLDKGAGKISLITVGSTYEEVKTMGGLTISPDNCIDNIVFKSGDLLILPGADTWMDERNLKVIDKVSELISQGVVIAAICAATIALANSGLLNNRYHTSNDKELLKVICDNYTGSEFYRDKPTVVDKNLITATGLAPLEFSYEVFKEAQLMKKDTLESWYQLYKTRDSQYYINLMESIK